MTSQVVSSGFLRLGLHHPLIIFDGRPRPGTRWWPWWKLSILPGELGETVGKANQWKRLIIEKKWRWSYFHEWASKNDPIVFWSQFFWAWFKDMWKFWFPLQLQADQTIVKRFPDWPCCLFPSSMPMTSLAWITFLQSLLLTMCWWKLGKFGQQDTIDPSGGWQPMKVDGWIGG